MVGRLKNVHKIKEKKKKERMIFCPKKEDIYPRKEFVQHSIEKLVERNQVV